MKEQNPPFVFFKDFTLDFASLPLEDFTPVGSMQISEGGQMYQEYVYNRPLAELGCFTSLRILQFDHSRNVLLKGEFGKYPHDRLIAFFRKMYKEYGAPDETQNVDFGEEDLSLMKEFPFGPRFYRLKHPLWLVYDSDDNTLFLRILGVTPEDSTK